MLTQTKLDTSTLVERYIAIRSQSIRICDPLRTEDFVVQPHPDISPPKWHLGHSTWFFENFILCEHAENYKAFDLSLNYYFNSYYESQGPKILRSQRGNMTRPSVERIMEYRKYVDEHLKIFLLRAEKDSNINDLIEVGLQHEQQHQELLLTDIKYILGTNPMYPAYQVNQGAQPSPSKPLDFLLIEGGLQKIGHQGADFCWDNELAVHNYFVEDFQIANRLINNEEYLQFIESGGYENHNYWLSEGWEWIKGLDEKGPLYWHKEKEEWKFYSLNGGLRKIDLQAPVTHISYFEADAFANWRGCRLATEFEWETAYNTICDSIPRTANFLENENFEPQVNPEMQMMGDCWEWTSSAYLPYPRYPRFKGALGEYNGKFMANQMVLRGGSCATPRNHIRPTYRNFFPTDKRWQFTGIRLAKDL